MPNIVPVDATTLPKSRRAALGLFAGLSALVATPAVARAMAPTEALADDAELFALAEPIAAADAALEAVNEAHSAAEDAYFASKPKTGSKHFGRRQRKTPHADHRQNGPHTKWQ
jgi:hypothetical protein